MCDPGHDDPVVEEIRKIRDQISAEFGHDPVRYVEYLIERQKRHADRLVSYAPPEKKTKDKPSA